MTYPFLETDYALTVCRIVPENNIDLILDAFSDYCLPLSLVIIGNWDVSSYGKELFKKYHDSSNITLLPPIYDYDLLSIIRSHCALYLHGHSCGGTNPSLVEAMYLGLPVASYNINFNRETTERKALFFQNAQDLRVIIKSFSKSQFQKIANDMKEIANRRYTWNRISQCYAKLF